MQDADVVPGPVRWDSRARACAVLALALPVGTGTSGIAAGQRRDESRPAASTAPQASRRALLDRYCVTCHNNQLKIPAGSPLFLDTIVANDVSAATDIWERVIRKV